MKEKIKALLLEKRRYELKEKISIKEKFLLLRNFPIQKIIGYVEMANVKIDISKKVLIPRYETEELIFHAINFIKKNNYKDILDLCSGSGFIGIALKKNIISINVVQADISKKAIKQNKKNLIINNVKNTIIRSNMFDNIPIKKFDVIISNPPYLLEQEKNNMSKSVLKFEPHNSLFAKKNGLEFYEIIEEKSPSFLNKNGLIILEINPNNKNWFINKNYKIIDDINGKARFAYKKINRS